MERFKRFHFAGQKNREEIIMVVHRHWFNILEQMVLVFGMVVGLFTAAFYLPLLFPVLTTPPYGRLFLFLENLFAMLIWMIFFLIWVDYYLDVWIITNLRIINVEQKGLFHRATSEMGLGRIQDVTTEVKGVIPTFLNYGDVFIQTAAETERFMFRQVPDPYHIKDQVVLLQKKHLHQKAEEFRKVLDGENL
jgi:uncharacterized membrane protein YdbT with pleckstrin-like domain